ncbi:putative bifunctional amine oxidase DDB_G0291301 [Dendronephthya gigantea]|uniref:putative bifunctional amine oxidase DDB_G0291301 n=1 Tax=Dendronephthya gigantea TaxID=151771 RepID=UPI00106C98C0|nr:putative bifunctional amine oxidase DDB_G0291301 [Dendronephthya gigantea]
MEELYDVIIVGGGPMGLAAAYECSVKEGKKVLLLEQFNNFANVHGSSPGYSRQYRIAYSEMNLCDLALKTYDMWMKLQKEMNDESLLQVTGCLWFGDSTVESGEGNIDQAIKNLKKLGQEEGKDYIVLEGKEEVMNDPRFTFVSSAVADIENAKALFTGKGGTVNVPSVVQRYVEKLTASTKATLKLNARVIKIDHSLEDSVKVTALVDGNEKTYKGTKIILTPGAYVNEALDALSPCFNQRINLIIYLWCSTYYTKKRKSASNTDPAQWPIWYFFGPKPKDDGSDAPKDYNDYYGFPSEPGSQEYLRVAPAYTSREEFDFLFFPPDVNQRPVDVDALKFTTDFVEKSMPDLTPSSNADKETTCIAGFAQLNNDVSGPDQGAGFVLDFLPKSKRIVVFTGGWAMKFVPMIGKILADLAIRGKTEYQDLIDPMNINRGILVDVSECQGKSLMVSKMPVTHKWETFRKIWC